MSVYSHKKLPILVWSSGKRLEMDLNWILCKPLINFILLNLSELKTSKERAESCEKLGAGRAGLSENILWCLIYLLILSSI